MRWHLSGVSTVKFLSSAPPFYHICWKEVPLHSPHEGSFALPSGGQNIYQNYLEFSCKGDLSSLPHLFIYSAISLFQYGLVDIYFTVWITIQTSFFFCSNCSSFYHWELFQLALVSLWCTYVIVHCFLSTSLLSGTARCSSLIYF